MGVLETVTRRTSRSGNGQENLGVGEGNESSGADFLGRRILLEGEFKGDHQALEKGGW